MSLHPVCKKPNQLLQNEIKTNDYLRNENAYSVVLMLHNVRIATFSLHFLYHTTSEYLRNSRNSRRNLLQKRQNLRIHFPCEMNELCHLWERHYLQPRRHAHWRQMTCTHVGAGRGRVPVRNCVLFLVSAMTARVLGPRQAESQGLRQPGIRLQRQSQTGPNCLHSEQSRFQVDVTEKEAEKKD